VIDLPPQTRGVASGGPLPTGAREIANDSGRPAYSGPCPPGGTHRYFFKLYALKVARPDGLTRKNCAVELARHAAATAETMGTYQRKGTY
jgi:phosphatidylethanolamine-binding protein (PEBP) family uncharacterized protein